MRQFTHGSLFSGSGGFDEGARRNGITSLWCSEIEPFPIRVLRKNFPNAKQLGDVSMVRGDKIAPVECARLQGFPDWWCDDLTTTDEEDVRFFLDVWFRYWTIMRGSKNPKTESQVRKWLANEPSDSDVYKMWGNGVALPNVEYIFRGIRRILEND